MGYKNREIVDLGLGVFNPIKVSTKFRNWMIKEFERMGCLTHSSRMDTVGYIIRHCEDNNIPYLLTCPFGMGFIKRL